MNEKSHPYFFVSRLKFVRQGSNLSGESGRWPNFFWKVRITKMRVLGWLDVFMAVRLALQHSCEKASYVCSLSSVGTDDVARLWVGL